VLSDIAADSADEQGIAPFRLFQPMPDLIIIGAEAIIPLFYLYYWSSIAWLDNDDPYVHLEDLGLGILIVVICFALLGYACALRSRLEHPTTKEKLAIVVCVAIPCLIFSTSIASSPPLWLFLVSGFPIALVALSQFVPKSRPIIPLLGLTAFISLYHWPFMDMIWEDAEFWNVELSEWKQEVNVLFGILYELFFLCAYAPAFVAHRREDPIRTEAFTAIPEQMIEAGEHMPSGVAPIYTGQMKENHEYITIEEAATSVLPAIGVLFVGAVFAAVMHPIGGIAIWIGLFGFFACMLIAQFKLLADAINRGIRASNRDD
jgi:hypothetical protein